MCSVCCVSQQNSCSCIEPLGTCVCVVVCVYMCKGQTAVYHCHSQRQRKTLMLFHSDTYLTPLSLTLTLLQADICVLVCRTVTSHQTTAPKLWPKAHSSPPQSFFSSLTPFLLFLFISPFPNPSAVWIPLLNLKDLRVDTSGFISVCCVPNHILCVYKGWLVG